MSRKYYLTFIFIIALFASLGISASAQTHQVVSGRIVLQQADQKQVPVEGATVELYRADTKGSPRTAKTDKRGNFSFAGVALGPPYALAVSSPGASPRIHPGVKAGDQDIIVVLPVGDGKQLTEDEVRATLAQAATATPQSEEEAKKAQAEYEKKLKEVEAKNKEIEGKNAAIQKALDDGNAAFKASNFDTAIASYTTGIDLDPEYVGSAPVLLNNRGAALRQRAVKTYNESVKLTDQTAKREGFAKAKKDLADAVEGYNKSLTILKSAPAGDPAAASYATQKKDAVVGAKDALRLMALTEQVDDTKLDMAKTLLDEYAAVETDAAKKAEAKLVLADLYRVGNDFDKAIVAYRDILSSSPDNVDALAGAGFVLVNLGYINNDKAQLQEGANYLQKFAGLAPANHKYKDDAQGLIDQLKADQNVTPQKTSTRKKN